MKRIGILALQGGYGVHAEHVKRCGACATLVRSAGDLADLDGPYFPGGESTAQWRLIKRFAMGETLSDFVASGRPLLATCAGLILAASTVTGPTQDAFGWLDIDVQRNGWGRQISSFEAFADEASTRPTFGAAALPMMFIRAPRITRTGPDVHVLGTYRDEAVLIRQGVFFGATFHPELSTDLRIHRHVFDL